MSVRAFACSAPDTGQPLGYVALSRVAEWPAEITIVRLRIGADWRCARLDRTRAVEVEGLLLRDAVPSDAQDCPDCAEPPPAAVPERAAAPAPRASPSPVQAAAVSLQGTRMIVVLVRREVIDSPGEAALLQGALQGRFGGHPLVLMGQDEDGSAHYWGDAALIEMLRGLPVERMPWKTYPGP